jgi:hypothetical protein
MEQETLRPIMLTLAVAMPAVGICLLTLGRLIAREAGEPMPPSMRRAGWLLILAGPLNLAVWFLFNAWLETIGYRSVIGYALAALVFFAMGWGTGALGRLRARWSGRDRDTADAAQTGPGGSSQPPPDI